MLKTGAWSGSPAWIVAGGPSLRLFDFSLLRDVPHCIAINAAFYDVPTAEVMISEDARVFERFAPDLSNFNGVKVFACPDDAYVPQVRAVVPDATIIHTRPKSKGWSKRLEDGLSTSSCSLIPALNLADVMGANPIYLLGVDLDDDPSNYHKRYPSTWSTGAAQMESYRSDCEHWAAPNLRHRAIINLNKSSAVTSWARTNAEYNDAVRAALKAHERVMA